MIDHIRAEIARAFRQRVYFAFGAIEQFDAANYQARARILTTGVVTNWLRVATDYSGAAYGRAQALVPGDEVYISFPDGNPQSQGIILARLFGQDTPPALADHEFHYQHESGTELVIRKDGSVEITGVKESHTSHKSHTSHHSDDKLDLSASSDLSAKSDSRVLITAQGTVEITGSPTVNLNGSALSAVIFEKLNAQWVTVMAALDSHVHIGNLGAPTPLLPTTPFSSITLSAAQSMLVKLGG